MLIVTWNEVLSGGTLLTKECAKRLGRPVLHVSRHSDWREQVHEFFKTHSVEVLNVAGPRESSAPGIRTFVHEVLNEVASVQD